MTTPILIQCKKICLTRCIDAIRMSVFVQFVLLAVFLLFVNFSILHPIQWITMSLKLIISPYTWLLIIPLIVGVIIYSCLLGRELLAPKHYYATRFSWIVKTFPKKLSFLCLHILIGLLTALFYTKYLHDNYKSVTYECYDGMNCLNCFNVFLLGAGITASCFYYIKEDLKQEPEIQFPLLQEIKWVKIRSVLCSTLYNSLLKSITQSVIYSIIFWIIASYYMKRTALYFHLDLEEDQYTFFATVINIRLLFYNWILMAQIYSNMYLIKQFLSISLTEEITFAIENKSLCATDHEKRDITLVDALAMEQLPIIQNLAALYLYNMGSTSVSSKRQEIFALSIPGNHPYNWNQLSTQCLCMLNNFIEGLNISINTISTIKCSPIIYENAKSSTTEIAERILLRQYNQMHGIRRMTSDLTCPTTMTSVQRANAYFEHIYNQWQLALQTTFRSIPGLLYLFCETEGAKTAYLLSQSQIIIWIIQGLACICKASLKEDRYGIIQNKLPQIIRTFVQLKNELDKLQNVILNGKRMNHNLHALRNTVKHSLYQICTTFGDYLDNIIDDQATLRILNCCVNYQDI